MKENKLACNLHVEEYIV